MPQKKQPAKRKRGVLLSPRGWQRLQTAELRSTQQENGGKPYTLQELGEKTGLSSNTLARVRSRKVPVDQQTIEAYFRAFNLVLHPEDYTDSDPATAVGRSLLPPNGQLPINSEFYIARHPEESLCYETISQPGGLVRLKAPRQMGKTSLAVRVLAQARASQYATVMLNLRLADSSTFSSLSRFLQWLCLVVSQELGVTNRLQDSWEDLFGASYNCTHYFESYLMGAIEQPLVLVLDEVDAVFEYPEVASDFFGMLRAWYEKARYGDAHSERWKKLRLMLVHSTEVYLPLNVAQSPFNAGLMVELSGFGQLQAQELAQRYGLPQPQETAAQLLHLVGDNAYLLHLGLYHLSTSGMTLQQLLENALSPKGIYSNHLRNQLSELQRYPELVAALKQVVLADRPVQLEPIQAFKLQSKGLIEFQNQEIVPSCELYRRFFAKSLASD